MSGDNIIHARVVATEGALARKDSGHQQGNVCPARIAIGTARAIFETYTITGENGRKRVLIRKNALRQCVLQGITDKLVIRQANELHGM